MDLVFEELRIRHIVINDVIDSVKEHQLIFQNAFQNAFQEVLLELQVRYIYMNDVIDVNDVEEEKINEVLLIKDIPDMIENVVKSHEGHKMEKHSIDDKHNKRPINIFKMLGQLV